MFDVAFRACWDFTALRGCLIDIVLSIKTHQLEKLVLSRK